MVKSQFAVIKTGGKQYKVSEGTVVTVEKIKGDFAVGDKIVFDSVTLKDDGKTTILGTPSIKGSSVEGELIEVGRQKKVIVIQYKQKSRYFKKNGHRQPFFKVKVTSIK